MRAISSKSVADGRAGECSMTLPSASCTTVITCGNHVPAKRIGVVAVQIEFTNGFNLPSPKFSNLTHAAVD